MSLDLAKKETKGKIKDEEYHPEKVLDFFRIQDQKVEKRLPDRDEEGKKYDNVYNLDKRRRNEKNGYFFDAEPTERVGHYLDEFNEVQEITKKEDTLTYQVNLRKEILIKQLEKERKIKKK